MSVGRRDSVRPAVVSRAGGRRPGRLSQTGCPASPPRDVIAWLYRVVRNAAIDAGKADRRRQRRETATARPARWFVEPVLDGVDAEAAVAALRRLPVEEREVIVARLWGGLSFEQIAEAAGCSASTAFRRYSAGIDALRKELGAPCPNPSLNA